MYVADPPTGVSLEAVLSRMLSRLLRSPVPLPLDALLTCPPQSLEAVVDAFFIQAQVSGGWDVTPCLRLASETQIRGNIWGLSAGVFDLAENAGKLGTPLTPQDAGLIVLKPMRPFAAGELCAMKARRSAGDAAAAAAELRASGHVIPGEASGEPGVPQPSLLSPVCCRAQASACRSWNTLSLGRVAHSRALSALCAICADSVGSQLMYVRVAEDARPQPGKPLFSVSVEVSTGQLQTVPSNQLFSFRNGNSAQGMRAPWLEFAGTSQAAMTAPSSSSATNNGSPADGNPPTVTSTVSLGSPGIDCAAELAARRLLGGVRSIEFCDGANAHEWSVTCRLAPRRWRAL